MAGGNHQRLLAVFLLCLIDNLLSNDILGKLSGWKGRLLNKGREGYVDAMQVNNHPCCLLLWVDETFDPNGRKCLSMDGYTEIGRTVHSQANNMVAGAFLSSKKEDTTSHTQLTFFMQRLAVCWTFYSYYYVIPLHITLRMRLFLWKLLEPSGSIIKTWFHFSRSTIRRICCLVQQGGGLISTIQANGSSHHLKEECMEDIKDLEN
ncbi:hypothetical protein Peur_002315 [Populus x canadensis]